MTPTRHCTTHLATSRHRDRAPPPDHLATHDDLTQLRTELRGELHAGLADLRVEIAELRTELKTEMAELRTELKTEMRDLTTGQTRTMMLGLVGSITALTMTQLVVAALA